MIANVIVRKRRSPARRAGTSSILPAAALALLLPMAAAAAADKGSAPAAQERHFTFTYNAEIGPLDASQGPVDIFIPLAKSDDHQQVKRKITASIPGAERSEPEYKNEFWHARLPKGTGSTVSVSVTYDVARRPFHRELTPATEDATYKPGETQPYARFLQPDSLVPVSGPLVQKVRQDLPKTKDTPQARARAIYDYVVDTMEYKKVGTGWGTGSTEWACSQRYGNCTDFHALVSSLARAEKIPTRFEIGFSIPEDKTEADIGGYHCWAELYLPQVGWTPIDASEAKKNPAKRDLFFGTHPADRLQFTVGRDIKLGDGHTTKPLNFFVYPHVEIAGAVAPRELVKTTFKFAEKK